jgi:hypothetical protein
VFVLVYDAGRLRSGDDRAKETVLRHRGWPLIGFQFAKVTERGRPDRS